LEKDGRPSCRHFWLRGRRLRVCGQRHCRRRSAVQERQQKQ
jgi:hypothetical protein